MTKPRVVTDNKPVTIDNEVRDLYNAINELPFMQRSSVLVLERSGVDTATIVWPSRFKTTNYQVALCIADSIETRANESVVWSVFNKTAESCMITALFVVDSTRFDAIGLGERP